MALAILFLPELLSPDFRYRLVVLDVGQGDSILLQTAEHNILIDGGIGRSTAFKIEKYLQLTDRKLDIVILTHSHSDHYGGLEEIVERFEVGEFWVTEGCFGADAVSNVIRQKNVPIREVNKGDNIISDELLIEVLSPAENYVCDLAEIENNSSVALHVYPTACTENAVCEFDLYLMGDAEKPVEELLVPELSNSTNSERYTILKAGHHCSKTSSSEVFLETIDPDIAICSAGKSNKYGHPSREVTERFKALDIEYFVTYEEGDFVWEYGP